MVGALGCVEVAFQTPFKKKRAPSRSSEDSGEAAVLVRRSLNTETVLVFSVEEWRNFIAGAKAGEFDPPK